MNSIISGIKSIVFIITLSEFLKNFLIGDKFKKYITVSVNILVVGFIIGQLKNVPYADSFNIEFPDYTAEEYQNPIKEEYENRVKAELKKQLENKKIMVTDIELEINEDYSINKITAYINAKKDIAEEIIKGMKPKDYEIIIINTE